MKRNDKKKDCVAGLVEKMKTGETGFTLAYYAPEDIFHQELLHRKVKGTLMNYEKDFGRPYHQRPGSVFVVYWDLELEAWRTFRICHLVTEGEV